MNFASPGRKLLSGTLVVVSSFAFAQAAKPTVESIGDTIVDHETATWSSPESVLNDLRSSNDDIRLKALGLVGLNRQQAHTATWSGGNSEPTKVVGQQVVTPRRVQLTYAALGEGDAEQAILALDDASQSVYAAVAVRRGNTWVRIAAISCWCKYDIQPDQDAVAEFISLRPTLDTGPPDQRKHFELVVHSSGGGSGVYRQTETHFRLYQNKLRNVLSFASAYRNGTPTVTLERRWFTFAGVTDDPLRGVLVEATGSWTPGESPTIQWDVRALLDSHLRDITCTAYRWDAKTFRYVRTNETVPACQRPANPQ
jgi:hypothetical protein